MTRKILTATLLLTLTQGIVSCSKDPAENAAQDACNCLRPMYDKLNEFSQAMASGDIAALKDAPMKDLLAKNRACFEELKAKYPEVENDKALQKKVTERINALCPAPKMFGQK